MFRSRYLFPWQWWFSLSQLCSIFCSCKFITGSILPVASLQKKSSFTMLSKRCFKLTMNAQQSFHETLQALPLCFSYNWNFIWGTANATSVTSSISLCRTPMVIEFISAWLFRPSLSKHPYCHFLIKRWPRKKMGIPHWTKMLLRQHPPKRLIPK